MFNLFLKYKRQREIKKLIEKKRLIKSCIDDYRLMRYTFTYYDNNKSLEENIKFGNKMIAELRVTIDATLEFQEWMLSEFRKLKKIIKRKKVIYNLLD